MFLCGVFGCSVDCPFGIVMQKSLFRYFDRWSRKYIWGNTELPFFSPRREGTVAKGSACFRKFWLPYSRGTGLSFLCTLILRKPCLRHFAWISSNAVNCTCCCVSWTDANYTVKTSCSCGNCDAPVKAMSVWMSNGGNGGSCPGTQSAVGYDAAASSDLSVLTEDCTNALSCCSSPFSCTALSFVSHRYWPLYFWLFNLIELTLQNHFFLFFTVFRFFYCYFLATLI